MSTAIIRLITVPAIVVILVISGFLLFDSPEIQTQSPEEEIQTKQIDPELVTGRWQRTDGGYVIEISSTHNNGTLEAVYLNPNPINVTIAEWSVIDDRLNIYVELSDINYPGSYYKLVYFPAPDQLHGVYYQAVYKQTYDVQFIRINNR